MRLSPKGIYTLMVVFSNYALQMALTNMTQASAGIAGVLRGAVAHLFINSAIPSGASTVSNFTEATFTSYVSSAITWTASYVNANGQAEIAGNTIVFSAGAAPTPQTVYGVFVTDSGGSNLLYAERFTVPVPITGQGSGLSYVPALVPSFSTGIPQN